MTPFSPGPAQNRAQAPVQPPTHQHRAVYIPKQHINQRRTGPLNVATGYRVSQPHGGLFRMTSSSSRAKDANSAKTSRRGATCSSSLPTVLGSLSSGVLIAAAALHFCGPDHQHVAVATMASAAASAASAVSQPYPEFGAGDIVLHASAPGRSLWALLLHSHQQSTAGEAAAALPASSTPSLSDAASAAAEQSDALIVANSDGAGDDNSTAAASLLPDARGTAQGGPAAVAVRGAVGSLRDNYYCLLKRSLLACRITTATCVTVARDLVAQLLLGAGGRGGVAAPHSAAAAGVRPPRRFDSLRTARLCLQASAFGTPVTQSYVKALVGGCVLLPAAGGVLNLALLPGELMMMGEVRLPQLTFDDNNGGVVNMIWSALLVTSSGNAVGTSAETAKPSTSPALASGAAAATWLAPASASRPCVATAVAYGLATAAVAAAVISAAADSRPEFGLCSSGLSTAFGIGVAAMGASLVTHGSLMTHGGSAHKASLPLLATAAGN